MQLENIGDNLVIISRALEIEINQLSKVKTQEEKLLSSQIINNLTQSFQKLYELYFESLDMDNDLFMDDDE